MDKYVLESTRFQSVENVKPAGIMNLTEEHYQHYFKRNPHMEQYTDKGGVSTGDNLKMYILKIECSAVSASVINNHTSKILIINHQYHLKK